MPNPMCEACKPDKPELHPALVERDGCAAEYAAVQRCMEQHSGSIAQCRDPWEAFRACHSSSKKRRDEA